MTHASVGKVLLVETTRQPDEETLSLIKQLGSVHIESGISAALNSISREPFDWVLTPAADFDTFDTQALTLHLNAVLDAIGQAVCIYDTEGRLVWSNSKAQQLPAQVSDRIRKYCSENFSRPDRTP